MFGDIQPFFFFFSRHSYSDRFLSNKENDKPKRKRPSHYSPNTNKASRASAMLRSSPLETQSVPAVPEASANVTTIDTGGGAAGPTEHRTRSRGV